MKNNTGVTFVMTIITGMLYGGALALSVGMIIFLYCLLTGDWEFVEHLHITFPLLMKMAIWLCIGWCVLVACYLIGSFMDTLANKNKDNPYNPKN